MSLEIGPRLPELPEPEPAVSAAEVPEPSEPSAFADALAQLGAELDKGEALVQRASSGGMGGQMSASDLIALQTGIYRYTEAVDLAAKVVDRLSSSVKTVMQSPS
jgi:hypothetical protein